MRQPTFKSKTAQNSLIAVVALTAVSLAACGKATDVEATESDDSKGYSATPDAQEAVLNGEVSNEEAVDIAWFVPTTQNDYFAAVGEGIESATGERNATLTRFDAGFDEQTQYAQIQDAIATGKFDAFIVSPVSAPGVVPAVAATLC